MSHNPIRPWRNIDRRKSRQIHVGSVPVGGDAPISVQTMTNTPTTDIRATIAQVQACAEAGADIVRVSVPDEASSKALKEIVRESPVPIVADIHFHYKRGIEAAEAGAACLRINPGNIGDAIRVREVIKAARDHNCSIRIGVNAGSLEKHLLEKYGEPCPEAMIESGLDHIRILQDNDFHEFKISVKASDVFLAAAAYQGLAEASDAPIHLGITEAGGLTSGTIKSAIGLGNLLWMGIGDTIRVSLSADPVQEVKVGYEILKSLGLRHRGVEAYGNGNLTLAGGLTSNGITQYALPSLTNGGQIGYDDGTKSLRLYSNSSTSSNATVQLHFNQSATAGIIFNQYQGGSLRFMGQTATAVTGGSTSESYLSHYEEGGWPVDFYGLSAAFTSYANKVGSFIRIGSLVHVHGFIQLTGQPSFTTASDYLRLGPLPFLASSAKNAGYNYSQGGVACQNFNFHDNDYSNQGQVATGISNVSGDSYIIFQVSGNDNTRGIVRNSAIGADDIIEFSLSYRV